MTIKLHQDFRAEVARLRSEGADDQTLHDTLAELIDQRGIPVFLLEEYRNEPVIVALFAERGQRLMTAEQVASLDAGTLTLSDITATPPEALCPACEVRHAAPFHYATDSKEI